MFKTKSGSFWVDKKEKKEKKRQKKKNNTNIKCHTKFQQKTLKQWEACLTNKKGKVSANPLLPCL